MEKDEPPDNNLHTHSFLTEGTGTKGVLFYAKVQGYGIYPTFLYR